MFCELVDDPSRQRVTLFQCKIIGLDAQGEYGTLDGTRTENAGSFGKINKF
jgi:hypothetical protein